MLPRGQLEVDTSPDCVNAMQQPPSLKTPPSTTLYTLTEEGDGSEDRFCNALKVPLLDEARGFDEISWCSTTFFGQNATSVDGSDLEPQDGDDSPFHGKTASEALSHKIAKNGGRSTRLDRQQLQTDVREAWEHSHTGTLDFGRFLEVSAAVFEKYDLGPSTPTRRTAAVIQDVFQELMGDLADQTSPQAISASSSTNTGLDHPRSSTEKPCDRYVLLGELLGGGATGVVQKAFEPGTGREVAIKRLQRDSKCPLRFLEISPDYKDGVDPSAPVLHLEGYTAAGSPARPCAGSLFFDSLNPYGKDPFQACASGCVVLVWRGGGVPFADKVFNAFRGGAVGVLIINTHDYTEEYAMGDASKHKLPSVLISSSDGEAVLRLLSASETLTDFAAARSSSQAAPPSTLRRCCVAEMKTDAEHEVAICRRLRPHPQVIQILDTWDEGGMPVVVTEICTGGRLPRGAELQGDTKTALWLLKQILAGVAHLHEHGVCHRDLKPENLLMTRPLGHPDARLVIIDFGMAGVTENMSVPCGSARYLAPEVAAGQYGPPRDVWVAGVVGYELLWGDHPFAHDRSSDAEVIQAITTRKVTIPPCRSSLNSCNVPESACDLVRILLQKDPTMRPTASEAMRHVALEDIEVPGWIDRDSS